MINIRASVQTVLVGSAVEFECLAFGDPKPDITWSKVGGQLSPGVLASRGLVKIERVEQADAGKYRCSAANDVGTAQSHVILHVQGKPRPSPGGAASPPCSPQLTGPLSSHSRSPSRGPARGEGGFRRLHRGFPLLGFGVSRPGNQVDQGGSLQRPNPPGRQARGGGAVGGTGKACGHGGSGARGAPLHGGQACYRALRLAVFQLEGDLPSDAHLEGNSLTIPSARPEDTGVYVCTASNRQGKGTAFSMLKVRGQSHAHGTGR